MSYLKYQHKEVYYDSTGKGYPLLLLHGNVVSSKMFDREIDFWSEYFQVIYFDYPGHGKSERLERFSDDFWLFNAGAAELVLEELNINKCNVIGTSGGALVGLNLAGLVPNKISKMIVDSFFGLRFSIDEAKAIVAKRTKAKQDLLTSSFWKSMHGDDWEQIVDNDFDMMLRTANHGRPIIHTDLNKISFPVLGIASEADELINNIGERLIETIDLIPNGKAMIFKEGKHPFMITKYEKFREIAFNFLMND